MNGSQSDASLTKLVQSIALLAAVSRHGSFAGAAQDLGLEPSAVSHRIRALETALGLALFNRTTRRVLPNRAGALLCEAANRSLDEVERALVAAQELRSEKAIRLSVHSSLLELDGECSEPSQHFDRADLMLQGAIGGLGIALGRSLLIEDDVRLGLLKPIGEPVRVPSAYWFVTTAEMAGSVGIRLLGEWLKEQIESTLDVG